jgi:beta-lactamase class D
MACSTFSMETRKAAFFARSNTSNVMAEEGNCSQRHSPCSSFKPVIALMGFDHGFLQDADHPVIKFEPKFLELYDPGTEALREFIQEKDSKDLTPREWMKISAVWYSQIVTQVIGDEQFAKYLFDFKYGNQESRGDSGKDNGLTNCWLMSSLKVSVIDQVEFMEILYNHNHSQIEAIVSRQAIQKTREILALEDLPEGWKLFGKTGGGTNQGWFSGWVERDQQFIAFSQYIVRGEEKDLSLGKKAKDVALEKVVMLIKEIRK